jgi:hypothetical protein
MRKAEALTTKKVKTHVVTHVNTLTEWNILAESLDTKASVTLVQR